MREQIFWEGSLDTTFLVPYDSMNRFGVLFGLFWPYFSNFGYNLAISLAPQQKMVVGGQWKQRWREKKSPLLILTNMRDACTKGHSSVSKWIFCRAWNCTKVASKIVWNYFFNWNVKSIDFDDLEIIAWILLRFCENQYIVLLAFHSMELIWNEGLKHEFNWKKKGASCRWNINCSFFPPSVIITDSQIG